jgi:cold shock CspA family protein
MNKKELEKKKQTKKEEKLKRKEDRKGNKGNKSFDDMIAYVDENGRITDTPPDPHKITEIDVENISISTPKKEDIEELPLEGKVDFFNKERGFGFIKEIHGADKYFFHVNDTPPNIEEGNKVTFELAKGAKGLCAVKIAIVANKK